MTQNVNYGLQHYEPMRIPLMNNNTSYVQAANILKLVWTAQNTIDKQLWQDQIDEDNREIADCQALKNAEVKRIAEKWAKEKEETQKEERKENSTKLAPILKRGIPLHMPIIPAPSAIQKMELGQYVSLWYWLGGLVGGWARLTRYSPDESDLLSDSGI